MQFRANLSPQAARLVVVGSGRFERRVGVAHQHVVLFELGQTLVANPLRTEDGAVHDRVVHHLLLPCAVAHEVAVSLCLRFRPLLLPHWFAVSVHRLYLGEKHALCARDVVEHRVLADKVAHHDEASTTHIERTEERLLHPVRKVMHQLLVAAQLVIVQVVDDDVVRTSLTVA